MQVNEHHGNGPESPNRRKLRKGTRSCWECKRRKAKCSLSQTSLDPSVVCDGCKRRGTRCIGQQYPDSPSNNKKHFGYRLGRVEDLLEGLSGPDVGPRRKARVIPQARASLISADQPDELPASVIVNDDDAEICLPNANLAEVHTRPEQTNLRRQHSTSKNQRQQKLATASKELISSWPVPADLEVITSAPTGTASVFRGLICTSYKEFMAHPLPSVRELLTSPEPTLHPVLIARKLLILAIFLQNLSSAAMAHITGRLTVGSHELLMENAFDVATRLVTNNDELTQSIEGIECIMMAALYLNNSSSLRLAYLAIRRALIIAQTIGLDRSPNSSVMRMLDSETSKRIKPEFMWFRLIQTDRYLSLQQGLPQGYIGDTFAIGNNTNAGDLVSPEERFELLLTVAAGRILQRNSAAMLDLEATRDVDDMLLKGATSMSPQWWLCPDLTTPHEDERGLLHEMTRLHLQLGYYEVLERLHLPFLLQQSSSNDFDYSKMTAVTASREVLARFIVFRGSSPPRGTFCRGIDFVAFSACAVTCLGHIDARLRRHDQHKQGARTNNAVSDCLAHQRLSDRGMMERSLSCLETALQDDPSDAVAQKICRGMRYLLAVEADVASGMAYRTESMYHDEARDELECESGDRPGVDGSAIRIHIPHLGTIRIEPNGTTGALYWSGSAAAGARLSSATDTFSNHTRSVSGLQSSHDAEYSSTVPETYPPSTATSKGPEHIVGDGQVGTQYSWPLEGDLGSLCFSLEDAQDGQWASETGNGTEGEQGDAWVLQGMDSAFFESLLWQTGNS